MSDPNYPIKPDIKPEVKVLLRGIAHPRSNISAIYFDGKVLADLREFSEANPYAGHYNPANLMPPRRW